MKKPENPPAFPFDYNDIGGNAGMTMLDYFAAKAMQGFIIKNGKKDVKGDIVIRDSYRLAYYMLIEREKHL